MKVPSKRCRLKPPYRWAINETEAMLDAILDKLAEDPHCYEKPLIKKFYMGLKRSNNILVNIDYRIMKSKMRNLKTLYKTALDFKKNCTMEENFAEYVARACPFFWKLDRIFRETKSYSLFIENKKNASNECISSAAQQSSDIHFQLGNILASESDDNDFLLSTTDISCPRKYFQKFLTYSQNLTKEKQIHFNPLSVLMVMHLKREKYREKVHLEKLKLEERKWNDNLKLEKEKLKIKKQENDSNKKIALMRLELEMEDKKLILKMEEKRLQTELEERILKLEMQERIKKYEFKMKQELQK